jgi:hypothetical protein
MNGSPHAVNLPRRLIGKHGIWVAKRQVRVLLGIHLNVDFLEAVMKHVVDMLFASILIHGVKNLVADSSNLIINFAILLPLPHCA